MAFILQPVGNYYPTRNEKIVCGVMHITAGATDYNGPDTSAEGTLNWFKQKGSNVSIHGIVDSDTVQDCLPDEYTAWHAKGYNSCSIGLEIGTGQVDWRKAPQAWVDATIRNAAKWWAPRIVKWKIPLVKVGKAAVDAERRKGAAAKPVGFIGHGDLDPANRSDPGLVRGVDTFPWALFFTYAQQEVNALTGKTGADTGKVQAKPLTLDGSLGPLTVAAWQRYYGSTPDGVISDPSALISKVQDDLNRIYGITPALSSGRLDWLTEAALMRHYGAATRAGWVKALQAALNKAGK